MKNLESENLEPLAPLCFVLMPFGTKTDKAGRIAHASTDQRGLGRRTNGQGVHANVGKHKHVQSLRGDLALSETELRR